MSAAFTPTARASSRRQGTRPPASGTPRPPRRCGPARPHRRVVWPPSARRIAHRHGVRGQDRPHLGRRDRQGDLRPARPSAPWSRRLQPDGSRIVTASEDKTARIWDAATGREICGLRGHRTVIRRLQPDGSRIVTASADKTARIWDAATAKEIAVLRGHTTQW